MKLNRKNFLKLAGLAGAGLMFKRGQAGNQLHASATRVQKFNMHGYAAS